MATYSSILALNNVMDRGAGKATSKGSQRDMTEQLNTYTYRLHTYVVQNWNLNESKSLSSGPSLSLLQCHLQWDQSPCSFKNPGLSLIQWFPFPVPDTCPRCSRVSPGLWTETIQPTSINWQPWGWDYLDCFRPWMTDHLIVASYINPSQQHMEQKNHSLSPAHPQFSRPNISLLF